MGKRSYSSEKADKMVSMPSIKSNKLAEGDTVQILDVREVPEIGPDKDINVDYAVVLVNGTRKMKLPLREYLKLQNQDDSFDFANTSGDDGSEFELVEQFKIVSSADRLREGEKMWPINAFALSDKLFKGEVTFDECMKGDYKENHTEEYTPIQDYTVAL